MSDTDVRIIILLMIKNESKIIRRSIDSTLHIADAICIEDTGSTDNTVEVITEHFKGLKIPAKLAQHPWKNFGYSRSHSFQSAKEFCAELGWNPAKTYALAMDADMNLVVGPSFSKAAFTHDGYQLVQKNHSLVYINMRLMRMSGDWKCVGATHEYWSAPPGSQCTDVPEDLIFIDDRNDGGCKADKFTRDRDLLIKELEEQPTNVRTHFYLAQTYKCLGDLDNSIKLYKKRIALGGWFEEVWYSHYMLVQLYLSKKMPEKAELWAQRAYSYNNYRAEALYTLVNHFRINPSDQWKAMHYLRLAKAIPKPRVALFLESPVYDVLLDYEYTVLQYYVNPVRKEGATVSLKYLLRDGIVNEDNVFSNLEYYTEPLPSHYVRSPLTLPVVGEYMASSPSVCWSGDSMIMNVRYVNYETRRDGTYHPRDAEGQVRTRNAYLNGAKMTFIQERDGVATVPSDLTVFPTRIHGFEDVRIFQHGGKMLYTSSACEFSPQYRIVMGEYDMSSNLFLNNRVLLPPTETGCEKNWLAVTHTDELRFIYGWYPLQIGAVVDGKLNIVSTFKTPPYFKKLRGSANPVLYNGKLYALVHAVKYSTPRKYIHHIVTLDPVNMKPLEISVGFAFEEVGIEYCLAMRVTDTVEFYYSHFDANPKRLAVPLSEFTFMAV